MNNPIGTAFVLCLLCSICALVLYEVLTRLFIVKDDVEFKQKNTGHAAKPPRANIRRLMASFAGNVQKVLPISAADANEYKEKLLAAGLKVEPITWRGILTVSTVFGIAIAALLGSGNALLQAPIRIATLLLGGLMGWALPKYYLMHKTKSRQHEIVRQLPDAMSLIKVMVDAGSSIEQCIREVGKSTQGALSDELNRTYREIALENDSRAALLHMVERCKSSDVAAFCRLLTQATKDGSAISVTLSDYRRTLRKEEHAAILQQIGKMDTKLTLVSMVCYVPVILLIIVAVIFNDLIGLFNNIM